MHEITESTLQTIAGTIEALLIEQREGIAFAYKKIPDGIKLSIGVNLDPTSQGVCVTYNLSFPLQPTPEPPEKCKVMKQETINDTEPLFDAVERLRPKADSGIDSVN